MKLERLDFKELKPGEQVIRVVREKPFSPLHKKEEPPPPPPSFSEAQMKEAEREGYKKGFVAGEKEGHQKAQSEQADVNKQLSGMLDHFVRSIMPMYQHYRQMVMQMQKDIPAVALAVAKKVAGSALDENAEKVVSEIALRTCETMVAEPELTITVNEKLGDALEAKLKEMAAKLPAATNIVILRDPQLPLADCRIEWRGGSLERVTQNLWQQVEKSLSNMEAIATRETAEAMDTLMNSVGRASGSTESNQET